MKVVENNLVSIYVMIDHRGYTHTLSLKLKPQEYSLVFFIIYGYNTNSQCDQLSVGLIAQYVEHCTGIAEVMASNPVQA